MASYKHIFIQGNVSSEKYRAPSAMGAKPRIPVRDRATQSQRLLNQFAEIWQQKEQLQQQRSAEQIAEFLATAQNIGIEVKQRSIVFPERAVLLINANREQLVELMLQSDLLAEFRAGQEPAGFWVKKARFYETHKVSGMIPDTTIKNFLINRGGFNCRHRAFGVKIKKT